MADRLLVVRRVLAAPQRLVFEAWTDPAVMARWFFAGKGWRASVQGEAVAGGSYRIDMISPAGETFTQQGVYREVVPYDRLSFTWTNGLVEDSLVVVELRPRGGETELVLTHALPDSEEVFEMHRAGWDACLENLQPVLAHQGGERQPPA